MADLWPTEKIEFSSDVFVRPLANVLIGIVLAVVMFLAILRFLPRGGLWGRMVLDASVGGEPGGMRAIGETGVRVETASLIGRTGVSATPLYPSGQVEISGKRYEARLAMGSAAAGTPVVVTHHGEFGLTVEVLS